MRLSRQSFARLSLALRALLYLVVLGAITYVGAGYGAGYIAVPGGTALRFAANEAGGDTIIFHKVECENEVKIDKSGNKTTTKDCDMPSGLSLEKLPYGQAAKIAVLVDAAGNKVTLRRNLKDQTTNISITIGDKTTENTFTGTNIPDAILAQIPEDLRAKVQKLVAADLVAAPRAAPCADPKATCNGVFTSDDGTKVEFARGADGKGKLTITKGADKKEFAIAGKEIPAEALQQIPEGLRKTISDFVAGRPMDQAAGKGKIEIKIQKNFEQHSELLPGDIPPPPSIRAGGKEGPAAPPPPAPPKPGTSGGKDADPPEPPAAPPAPQFIDVQGPTIIQQEIAGPSGIKLAILGATLALVLIGIIQLERLLAHFQHTEIFSARNANLVRNFGLVLVAVACVQACGTLLPAFMARAWHPLLLGLLGPHLILIFAGLAVLLLAAVFAQGAELEDDARHTI